MKKNHCTVKNKLILYKAVCFLIKNITLIDTHSQHANMMAGVICLWFRNLLAKKAVVILADPQFHGFFVKLSFKYSDIDKE